MNLKSKRSLFPFLLVLVAFLGVLDTTYLSVSELKGTSLLCGEALDCDGVTSSEYSRIMGIPVAYLGFLFYSTFFFISLTIATFKKRFLVLPLFLLSIAGFGASVWFVFAQLVLLRSVCIYCMFSAITSTTLFFLTLYLWRNLEKIVPPFPIDSTESEQV
ncbi:MAG: vitamin K epoxide reductase family protein [Candidatus Paceibacterota bacterium]